MKSSWLKSLGLKCHLCRRLMDISTPDFSTPWFKNSWLKSPGLKSSWSKILGLKGQGLKLGVEKSGVEMSFNPYKAWKPKFQTTYSLIFQICEITVFGTFDFKMAVTPLFNRKNTKFAYSTLEKVKINSILLQKLF